jgi:hypothetical protein
MKKSAVRALGSPVLVMGLVAGSIWAGGVLAQTEVPAQQVDALRCWRRIERNTIRVGEPFTMTVTCRVIATDGARAVPDTVGLEPETIDLLPFEVLGGRRFADVQDGPRLFFQYQYTLRLIGETYFGRDLFIPPIELNYRVERRFDDGRVQPGRELVYVLPSESVRVLSLVPPETGDLRALTNKTFGDAEERGLRADVAMFAAAGFGLVAIAVLVVGFVRAGRMYAGSRDAVVSAISYFRVARGALVHLVRVRDGSEEHGWTPGQIQQGLVALRLAGAVALKRPIAERVATAANKEREGELRVRSGVFRRKTRIISSSVTATALTAAIDESSDRAILEGKGITELRRLESALANFTIARYTGAADISTEKLTNQVNAGIDVLRALRLRAFPPVREGIRRIEALRAAWRDRWAQ